MPVAVVDVGSQTVRLLVATARDGAVESVHAERRLLALGDDIERFGVISSQKLDRTVRCVTSYTRTARKLGVSRIEIFVTAPGRQSENAQELLTALASAAQVSVRVLSPEDEARLAFAGALAGSKTSGDSIAVCDVGGGSTELAVGTRAHVPAWVLSVDLGALRLTRRTLTGDPPSKPQIAAARDEVRAALESVVPPLPQAALASGGSARALRRLVGSTLDPESLAYACRVMRKLPAKSVAKEFGLAPQRAHTLMAGCLILADLQRRIGVPLEIVPTGIREGVALSLFAEAAAA